MKPYVSIDLETTGLDPTYCQILEIGAVVDNGAALEKLPTFHAYIRHSRIVGEPYAMALNTQILAKLATPGDMPRGELLYPEDVGIELAAWLRDHYGSDKGVVAAGKNFGSFDLQFLKRLPGFSDRVEFKHRSIDPAMLYWNPDTDDAPPSTLECLRRAGLMGDVQHTAVADALQVVQLVRRWAEHREPKTSARGVAQELSEHFHRQGQFGG